jgi:hypothetical protein
MQIQLGGGVLLVFRGLVLTRFRSGSYNQAPSLDLLDITPPAADGGDNKPAVVQLERSALLIPLCVRLGVAR